MGADIAPDQVDRGIFGYIIFHVIQIPVHIGGEQLVQLGKSKAAAEIFQNVSAVGDVILKLFLPAQIFDKSRNPVIKRLHRALHQIFIQEKRVIQAVTGCLCRLTVRIPEGVLQGFRFMLDFFLTTGYMTAVIRYTADQDSTGLAEKAMLQQDNGAAVGSIELLDAGDDGPGRDEIRIIFRDQLA